MDDGSAWSRRRTTTALALLLALAPAYGPPAGLFLVADAKQGCAADTRKFCKSQRPGVQIDKSCLRQNWVSLSSSCRNTLRGPRGGDDSGDAAE